jgi:Zn-dependent protease/predicted transcriptional regulator
MGWSFPIARIAGIDIKVHVTFFLILVFGALSGIEYGAIGAAFGVLLMLLLFLCVTLHELGHSITAQRLGIPVREIVLLPLGGVALMSRNPSKAWQELVIAAAGPLVNVLIALLLWLTMGTFVATGRLDVEALSLQPTSLEPSLASLLQWLLVANVALVLFNLIPAFPLDGGRIFRALLAMAIGFPRATRIATVVGQIIAIGLGAFGFATGNWGLMLVAVFVFFGAGQENAEGQARTMLTTLKVGDAYNRHALTLNISDRVSQVVRYILTSYQPDFAVMQGGRPVGIVTRDDVLRALATGAGDSYVTQIMRRDIVRVEAGETLDRVREVMAEKGVRIVGVYQGETYLGLVSLDDMAEAYAVLRFLERQTNADGKTPEVQGDAPSSEGGALNPNAPVVSAAPSVAGPAWSDVPGGLAAADQERADSAAVAEAAPSPEQLALQQELQTKRRRLYALEVQYRFFGANTPEQIVSEMEELRGEVRELEGRVRE